MKKLVVALLAAFCLVYSFIGWKLNAYQHGDVTLSKDADFYLVYPDKIETFQLSSDGPILLNTQKMNSENYFGSGKNYILDNRYLVYANDQHKVVNDNLVSIDFKSGKILRKASQYASYLSGTDGQNFYTAGPYHTLAQFDKKFETSQTLVLNDDFIPFPAIYVDDASIYMTGLKRELNQADTEENVLLVCDKQNFFKQKVYKYDNNLVTGEGVMANGIIYLPVFGNKTMEYEKIERMSQLLTFDTSKQTFSSITLEHSSPSAIYPLKEKNLLFIEHTDYQFSPISFTIYNTETGEQVFHSLKELNPRPHHLEHVRQMDDRRLMMILSDTLIIYDLQTKKITNKTTLSEDYVSGVWVNP